MVFQWLGDGVGAGRPVNGDGIGLVGFDEVKVVVNLRVLGFLALRKEGLSCHLRCHEIGKHLFGPDVLKPSQRHHVAEPQVGCLMRNELAPSQSLFLRGGLVEEETSVAELYGSRMFHASKLVARQDDHAVLGKWTFQ